MITQTKKTSDSVEPSTNGHEPEPIVDVAEPIFARPVNLIMALRGLAANKMRAALTMLGVVIGVGAVIVAVGIGQGSRDAAAAQLAKLGTNVLTVFPSQQRAGGVAFGANNNLTIADSVAVLKGCPDITNVSPEVSKSAQVVYKDSNTSTTVYGTGPDHPIINNHPIDQGSYFTAKDVTESRRVAVLGTTAATDLNLTDNVVGKTILIQGQDFKVIGLLTTKGGTGFRTPDDGVYVPVTTAMRRLFGMLNIQSIGCEASSTGVMDVAQQEIDAVLRKQHRLSDTAAADYRIFNQADLMQAQDAQQGTFAALITCLAIVSLVVGGIGIMNIMLVSVTERTREIGVRMAIGATKNDILYQFLLEAILLSLLGGLLGVLFGVGGASAVQSTTGWTISVSPMSVVVAYGFSALVGVFAGLYPAIKAAAMRPIDALRYE